MAGPLGQSYFLDIGSGIWNPALARDGATRDYAPSVMYDSGKVLFTGGGKDMRNLPTNLAEIIDLNAQNPQWAQTQPMHFPRRQHNATVLPDGTVLVTGGTQGVAGDPQWLSFNDVNPGGPVHQAELWDPVTGTWTLMATESVDRCYHSTALLLPDGRVLSAGGGEYANPDPAHPNEPNNPTDSHAKAQLFNPPYLFKGARPTVSNAPANISYSESFNISVGGQDTITKVSWVRLGSVTHACNQKQSLAFLTFSQFGTNVTVQAPLSSNIAPPGHYMLFVLNSQGVPSVASITHISTQVLAVQPRRAALAARAPAPVSNPLNLTTLDKYIATNQARPPIVLGITTSCSYGIGACWGGAFDALRRLSNVEVVRPVPDTIDSVAFVYLRQGHEGLPDLDVWRGEFAQFVNGSYILRGIELTLSGSVTRSASVGKLALTVNQSDTRSCVEATLVPLQLEDKVQWDLATRAVRPVTESEATAFLRLSSELAVAAADTTAHVTGPLKKVGADYFLQVRHFEIGQS